MARRRSDIGQEVAALSRRLRIAYDLGELDAMAVHTDALIGHVDQLEADEERARAMASIAQSYGLRDHVEPAREWADKALALAEAHGFESVRRAAMTEDAPKR